MAFCFNFQPTYPVLPQPGYSQLRIFSGNPCPLFLHNREQNLTFEIPPLGHVSKRDIAIVGKENITFDLQGRCFWMKEETFLLEENAAVSFFVNGNVVKRYKDSVDKSKSGFPVVR